MASRTITPITIRITAVVLMTHSLSDLLLVRASSSVSPIPLTRRRGAGARPRLRPRRGRERQAGRRSGTRGRRAPRRVVRRTRRFRRAPLRVPPRRPCAPPARGRRAARRRRSPAAANLAFLDPPPQPRREARDRAGMARGPGRPDAEEDRVAVAVVAQLLDRRACCRTSRPFSRGARASGSRTRPRPSRACAGAPPRPSRRA